MNVEEGESGEDLSGDGRWGSGGSRWGSRGAQWGGGRWGASTRGVDPVAVGEAPAVDPVGDRGGGQWGAGSRWGDGGAGGDRGASARVVGKW
jgi:hypothetical protein